MLLLPLSPPQLVERWKSKTTPLIFSFPDIFLMMYPIRFPIGTDVTDAERISDLSERASVR